MCSNDFLRSCAYSMALLFPDQLAKVEDERQRGGHGNRCFKFHDHDNNRNCDSHTTCRNTCIHIALMAFVLFCFAPNVHGQSVNQSSSSESIINIFIDAQFVDESFLREEFPYVNYVRTRDNADVHILGTKTMTGGGDKYEFFFIGLKKFVGKTDTLSFFSSSQETQSETRDNYTKVIKMGLMRYMALASNLVDISISADAITETNEVLEDKWNSWVFEASLRGDFSGEESRKTQNWEGGLEITQTTQEWRHEYEFEYEYETKEFSSGSYHSFNETTEANFDMLVVKSLGPKAGIGILGRVAQNTVDNYDLNYKLSVAIEYNFFPYEISSRRQLAIGYYIGMDGRNYTHETVFDKTEEILAYEQLYIGYSQKEQWGNIYTTATFQNYLRDFTENNFGIDAGLNIRIWKGLSWNLSVEYSIINDDINISKEDVDTEDLLLGLRQLSTSKSYSFNTGLSFTFGSMYNNVVNTRLKKISNF